MDPFALTADPAAYIARSASERALAALERCVEGAPVAALSGPPGIGKTMLVRVLERRLAGRVRCLYVPYGALALPELCDLVLGLLEPARAHDGAPEAGLAEAARRAAASGAPLLLLLDDANAIPLPTLRELVALAHSLGGALRVLAVPVDDVRAAQVLAALGPGVGHVRFAEPMSADETARYVAARLAHEGVSDPALDKLTTERVGWLHRESGGLPRRLHQLVAWILHRDDLPPDTTSFDETAGRLELDAG